MEVGGLVQVMTGILDVNERCCHTICFISAMLAFSVPFQNHRLQPHELVGQCFAWEVQVLYVIVSWL